MAITENYRNLILQLKTLLPEYLSRHGIDSSKNFSCINPEHSDASPSCSLIPPERTQFRCFSCSLSGDIFSAAYLLEGLPTSGPEFVTENVFALADSFGFPREHIQLESKDRHKVECLRAFDLASSLLSSSIDGSVAKEVYGWELEDIRKIEPHIGTVQWAEFAKQMKLIGGYTQLYLETQFNITPQLFDSHLLTLCIKNKQGHVIGFAARDKRHDSDKRVAKWKNTSSDVPVFHKGGILYGIDAELAETGPLYLVEGYADVLRLRMSGLSSVLAYCSSSISREQAEQIQKLKRTEVVIVPDNEENGAGYKGIIRALDKVFVEFPEIRIKIKELPLLGSALKVDPGSFLESHTLRDFLTLEDKDAFIWRLDRFPKDLPTESIYEQAMPLICDEQNPVRQQKMLRQLASRVEMDLPRLQQTLDQKLAEKRRAGLQKAKQILGLLRHKLDTTKPEEATTLLRKTADEIEDAQIDKYSASAHGPEEFSTFLQDLKKEFDSHKDELPGWSTGFTTIDNAFEGFPKRECMITLAGDSNIGKSLACQSLALQIALSNTKTAVLLYTIDDSRSQTAARLVAHMTGLPIPAVRGPRNPRYGLTSESISIVDSAWADLIEMGRHGRLSMKDASQGNTIGFARSWIRDTRRRNPTWDILFVLDSFHRLTGLSGDGNVEKLEQSSNAIAEITKKEGVTVLLTAELRKRMDKGRPHIEDIRGAKQLEYDSNIVIILHNSMHAFPDSTGDKQLSWVDSVDGIKKPILELYVDKNKHTSYKGMFKMKLRPECSQMLDDLDVGPSMPVQGVSVPEE